MSSPSTGLSPLSPRVMNDMPSPRSMRANTSVESLRTETRIAADSLISTVISNVQPLSQLPEIVQSVAHDVQDVNIVLQQMLQVVSNLQHALERPLSLSTASDGLSQKIRMPELNDCYARGRIDRAAGLLSKAENQVWRDLVERRSQGKTASSSLTEAAQLSSYRNDLVSTLNEQLISDPTGLSVRPGQKPWEIIALLRQKEQIAVSEAKARSQTLSSPWLVSLAAPVPPGLQAFWNGISRVGDTVQFIMTRYRIGHVEMSRPASPGGANEIDPFSGGTTQTSLSLTDGPHYGSVTQIPDTLLRWAEQEIKSLLAEAQERKDRALSESGFDSSTIQSIRAAVTLSVGCAQLLDRRQPAGFTSAHFSQALDAISVGAVEAFSQRLQQAVSIQVSSQQQWSSVVAPPPELTAILSHDGIDGLMRVLREHDCTQAVAILEQCIASARSRPSQQTYPCAAVFTVLSGLVGVSEALKPILKDTGTGRYTKMVLSQVMTTALSSYAQAVQLSTARRATMTDTEVSAAIFSLLQLPALLPVSLVDMCASSVASYVISARATQAAVFARFARLRAVILAESKLGWTDRSSPYVSQQSGPGNMVSKCFQKLARYIFEKLPSIFLSSQYGYCFVPVVVHELLHVLISSSLWNGAGSLPRMGQLLLIGDCLYIQQIAQRCRADKDFQANMTRTASKLVDVACNRTGITIRSIPRQIVDTVTSLASKIDDK